jgi:2-aminoethylphosphonate-pyruvate transaminase
MKTTISTMTMTKKTTTDKLLFTPGPLTTSATVKAAMMRDAGSRDTEFIAIVRDIRQRLLRIGGAEPGGDYECVPMQGSGTFAIESVISSAIPRTGGLMVLVNGAYGRRIVEMARVYNIGVQAVEMPENRKISPEAVAESLNEFAGVTHVAVVHCETTTGIVNPIVDIGRKVARSGATYIVDAMSSFGAIPIDLAKAHADFLISSANKCIEGVPGFAFVLARRSRLMAAKGCARTLSLDLFAQWAALESGGQFRFTPPTHVLLAFHQALLELDAEGGVEGRAARYCRNYQVLARGMEAMGFEPYLAPEDRSYIITTYRYPSNPEFRFEQFYSRLSEMGYVIYPGKLSQEPCFRIGTIGRLSEEEMEGLLAAIREVVTPVHA